jgi:hypothetical protein
MYPTAKTNCLESLTWQLMRMRNATVWRHATCFRRLRDGPDQAVVLCVLLPSAADSYHGLLYVMSDLFDALNPDRIRKRTRAEYEHPTQQVVLRQVLVRPLDDRSGLEVAQDESLIRS